MKYIFLNKYKYKQEYHESLITHIWHAVDKSLAIVAT